MSNQLAIVMRSTELSKRLESTTLGSKSYLLNISNYIKSSGNYEELSRCSVESLQRSILDCAMLDIIPNASLGNAYLIPYKGQCQFQLSYKGMAELMWRTGIFTKMCCRIVHENDDFKINYGSEEKVEHTFSLLNRGKAIGVYSIIGIKGASELIEVMTVDEVENIRQKYSKCPNGPAWTKSFNEMAKKTVFKRATKLLPKNKIIEKIIEVDNKDYCIDEGVTMENDPTKPSQNSIDELKKEVSQEEKLIDLMEKT